MRFLAIGYPLPNKDIDNYNPLTAPSYFDYDGMFIDPESVTGSAALLLASEKEFESFDGRPVLNAPTTATSVSAADQLRRRHDETRRILEAGGTIIVMGRTNAIQTGIVGFEGLDRYSWLPAPAGLAWTTPYLIPGEGKNVRITNDAHPVADFIRRFRGSLSYRAVFDERQAPVRQGRILATGGSGAPVAMEFNVLGGRVLFMPAIKDETSNTRSQIAEAIVDLFVQLAGPEVEQEVPYWARSQPVPGLEQAEAELEELEEQAREAAARAAGARARHDTLTGYRALLWADGRRFEQAVEDALRLLGFAVTRDEEAGLMVESEGLTALVECESSREEVVEWPYVRLQRRLEAELLRGGETRRGIIVANGHRTKAPDQREAEFADTLRIACENYRYALVTGTTLFALVQRALGGADEGTLLGLRRRLLSSHGLLPLERALSEVAEDSDAGPIF